MTDDSFENSQPPPGRVVEPNLRVARRRRAPAGNNGHVDRLPPHSPENEQAILGCALLSPRDAMPYLVTKFRANDEVFYDLRHQIIFAHLMQMAENNLAGIDVITLQQRLKDFSLLDEIGGIPYLNSLQDAVPSSLNVSYYADIVLEKYMLRRMVQTCTEIVGRIYEHEGDVNELLDSCERDVMKIRGDMVTNEAVPLKDLISPALGMIESFYNRTGELSGIATGYADLDRMTNGLEAGSVYVIAARPSLGKTSLLLNIFDHISAVLKLPTAIFSLEMTKESLALRMLTSRARSNLQNIRDGFMSEADFPKLTSAAGVLLNAPIYIDDSASLSIMEIRARARAYVQKFGIKVFGIDYLGLARSMTKRGQDNRQQEIAEISAGVKALAKELRVPIILLSQLNREMERDKNRKPRLADLRESGAIEQDADFVGLLYKPKLDNSDGEDFEEPDGVPVNLLIAKQRNGPTGDVAFTFLKPYTKFESAAKVSDADVPKERNYQPTQKGPMTVQQLKPTIRELDEEARKFCEDLGKKRSGSMGDADTVNSRNMNPENPGWWCHYIGVIGELAYSWWSGHPVNQHTIGKGDDGTDFPNSVQVKSSDAKTKPNLMLLKSQWHRKVARIYVLVWVRWDNNTTELLGWITREEIEKVHYTDDLGRGETMIVASECLHSMEEMEA